VRLATCQTKPPVLHQIISPPDQPEQHPVQRQDQPLARAIITSITSTASSAWVGSVPPISKGKSKGRTTGDGPGESHRLAGWNQGRIGVGEREISQCHRLRKKRPSLFSSLHGAGKCARKLRTSAAREKL
jgi:hypothetical protein